MPHYRLRAAAVSDDEIERAIGLARMGYPVTL